MLPDLSSTSSSKSYGDAGFGASGSPNQGFIMNEDRGKKRQHYDGF